MLDGLDATVAARFRAQPGPTARRRRAHRRGRLACRQRPRRCQRTHQRGRSLGLAPGPPGAAPTSLRPARAGAGADGQRHRRPPTTSTCCAERAAWIGRMRQTEQGFDAFVCPTVPIVAPPLQPLIDDDTAFFATNAALLRNPSAVNYLDGCALSLPCQRADELPVGLMVWAGGACRRACAGGVPGHRSTRSLTPGADDAHRHHRRRHHRRHDRV